MELVLIMAGKEVNGRLWRWRHEWMNALCHVWEVDLTGG